MKPPAGRFIVSEANQRIASAPFNMRDPVIVLWTFDVALYEVDGQTKGAV